MNPPRRNMSKPDKRSTPGPRGHASRRRTAERTGRRAETLAALAYVLRGYSIIARRFRRSAGEIDLVLRRGDLVVFAEVKARPNHDDAVFAVDIQTRRRIERAGNVFLSERPELAVGAIRYDIVAVSGWRARIVADAWRAER